MKQSKIEDAVITLKKYIKKLSSNINFPHHEWFIKYHIRIVEKIALELCHAYPSADKNLVIATVWFHDYGKLIDFKNEHRVTQESGLSRMVDLGLSTAFAKRVLESINVIDTKKGLRNASIETKIVSSADGASHLVGPFFALHWRDNPNTAIEKLIAENKRKLLVDWNRKIVLPEVKKAFEARYIFLEEHLSGKLPNSFKLTRSRQID